MILNSLGYSVDSEKHAVHRRIMIGSVVIGSTVLAAALIVLNQSEASPAEITRTNMTVIFRDRRSIDLKLLTTELTDVPAHVGSYAECTVDGWGRRLKWRMLDNGSIEIVSYGLDGTPGGTGNDADISRNSSAPEYLHLRRLEPDGRGRRRAARPATTRAQP